ncbi:MAG: hypothetical protein HY216_12970, partial [Candidatus Rokubacteria bacterium]|nr:hypothetical protein [Candidatus Rokubacteria bacterium]
IHLTLTVPHTTDLGRALALAKDTVMRDVRVLKDLAPAIGVAGVADSGVKLAINPWARGADAGAAEGDLYRALLESFRAAEIGVGVPRREIRVVDGAALR